MKEEIYEPSLEPELLKEVRKFPVISGMGGVMPEGTSRIKGRPLFDLGRIENLLTGSIDTHIHPGPDPFSARDGDQIDLAIEACNAGMKGVLFKSHHVPTSGTVPLVQKVVNQWADEHNKSRLDIFGGVVLNYAVGGLNPEAVVVSARLGGRVVWPPNTDSSHFHKVVGIPGGIDLLDENDKVVPKMREILALIAEADLVLAMSCLGVKDVFYLIDEAKKTGVKRMNVIHPNSASSLMTVEQMKIAADKGAYIEITRSHFESWNFTWENFMEIYRIVGPDRMIMATDMGLFTGIRPLALFRHQIAQMLTRGVPDKDVEKMIKVNPTELLYP